MKQNLPGGLSAVVPPDPMPNSEVKRRSADGSVGSPHARVGNCQASNLAKGPVGRLGFFALVRNKCRMRRWHVLSIYGQLPLRKLFFICVTGVSCIRISGLSYGTVVPGHDVICTSVSFRPAGFALQGAMDKVGFIRCRSYLLHISFL